VRERAEVGSGLPFALECDRDLRHGPEPSRGGAGPGRMDRRGSRIGDGLGAVYYDAQESLGRHSVLLRRTEKQWPGRRAQHQGPGRAAPGLWHSQFGDALVARASGCELGREKAWPDHRRHSPTWPAYSEPFRPVLHLKTDEPESVEAFHLSLLLHLKVSSNHSTKQPIEKRTTGCTGSLVRKNTLRVRRPLLLGGV